MTIKANPQKPRDIPAKTPVGKVRVMHQKGAYQKRMGRPQ